MAIYIKDLIELPERVHGGDFVLKLTEGVEHPEETLRPYVVTPELARNFDDALDFIKGAIQSSSSKAAYLHGSFGSGKSHFMAVLHLLLQQYPAAKSKEGLAEVVTRHNPWLEGKRFLLVPYHMIGQPSMEAAVLGGYVKRVLDLHPGAPIPGVYRAAGLFHDAAELRKTLGDAAFFDRLNRRAAGVGGGWGDLEADWDATSFELALEAPPGSDDRSRLIGALVEEFFQSYKEVARGSQEAFVSLDDGLAIISRHAQSLGYDALVLFLDELILWLATHAADQKFLNAEGPKVSKLVEAESADRPIPIVSFVARQRDLRELVGEGVTGAEQLGFADVLRWWEARFDTITLEDRNLPEIAARRVLQPKSEAARQQIEQAWQQTERIREEVMSVLLTPNADRGDVPQGLPLQPGAGGDPDRGLLGAAAGAHGAQGDAAAAGRPARHPGAGPDRAGGRPVRRDRRGRRALHRGHAHPLRQRQAALPPEADADVGEGARRHGRRGEGAALRRFQGDAPSAPTTG